MVAGIIDHETGTRDIRKLGGLMSIMPISFTVAFIGSMSMAGVPLFGGFLSKELFLTSMLSLNEFDLFNFDTWGILFPIIAWVASVFTFVYSFYFVFHTFNGKRKENAVPKQPKEAPIGMLLSPIILAVTVVTIFFIPNMVAKAFVKPAVVAMQAGIYTHPNEVNQQISAWHGWQPELMMTLGIFGVGALLFITIGRWQKLYNIQPQSFSLNTLYDSMMTFSEKGMNRLSRFYMTGLLRSYLMYMFFFIVAITMATLFMQDAFKVDMDSFAPVNAYGLMTAIILIISVVMVIVAKTRLAAIIALGGVGYSVALFFVVYKAPDLALTQLVIETVSVALFLLAFRFLPEVKRHGETRKIRVGNFIIAAAVGVMVTLVALSAHSQKLVPSISQYYKDTVFTEAAGGNIVNVILVDYRGFDTLFEIAVLSIAAIGVYSMIKLRLSRKEKSDESE